MEFDFYEKKVLDVFTNAIKTLPKNQEWNIERNIKRKSRISMFEADAVISKEGRNYALVEVRMIWKDLETLVQMLIRKAEKFQCSLIFLSSKDEYLLIDASGYIVGPPFKLQAITIKQSLLREEQFSIEKWKDFFKKLANQSLEDIHKKEELRNVLQKIADCTPIQKNDKCIIPQDLEFALFESLTEEYKGDLICRFTSLRSLVRSIQEQSQSMCSIVCMNDKSEVNYVSNYLVKKRFISAGFYNGKVGDANSNFILSCCDDKKIEDLSMMRLYSDDARGVVIIYEINHGLLGNNSNFILRKINYQRDSGDHPELDILGQILNANIGGYPIWMPSILKWAHFFKPKEYKDEEEVRLLYCDSSPKDVVAGVKSKWIHDSSYNILAQIRTFDITMKNNVFPLTIDNIILAPKMQESEINCEQIENFIKEKQINISKAATSQLVEISNIDHYR